MVFNKWTFSFFSSFVPFKWRFMPQNFPYPHVHLYTGPYTGLTHKHTVLIKSVYLMIYFCSLERACSVNLFLNALSQLHYFPSYYRSLIYLRVYKISYEIIKCSFLLFGCSYVLFNGTKQIGFYKIYIRNLVTAEITHYEKKYKVYLGTFQWRGVKCSLFHMFFT